MEPPQYNQVIAEDLAVENNERYYEIYISGSSDMITFNVANRNGEVFTSTTHTLKCMKESKMLIQDACFNPGPGKSEMIYPIIEDLVNHFGPMELLYGNIRSQNSWPVNKFHNTMWFTFTDGAPQKWSAGSTIRRIYIPIEYSTCGSGGTNFYNGYYPLYY
jgi:hypothetical protein